MGLLGEIYSAFGLAYSIALYKLKQEDLSRTDKAFIIATATFLGLSIVSFVNQLRAIPCGYKCIFSGKSLLRGLLSPLMPLILYPVLLRSNCCLKKLLTFSNEAHDGVERTRQLVIYELKKLQPEDPRYLTTHDLLWLKEEGKWGYNRLVGEIWVKMILELEEGSHFDNSRKLQTSDWGTRLLLQYGRKTPAENPESILEVKTESEKVQPATPRARLESMKISCIDCICVCKDLESGSNPEKPPANQTPPASPASPDPPKKYMVTIIRSRTMFRIQKCKCCKYPGLTWQLSCRVVRHWTLLQIHQYMLCLDVWGNYPKQGIWKPPEPKPPKPKTCCPGCTSCCNAFTRIIGTLLECLRWCRTTILACLCWCCTTILACLRWCRTNNQPQNPPQNNQAKDEVKYRYCYRHDELIDAIQHNMRLTRKSNNATWYTVV